MLLNRSALYLFESVCSVAPSGLPRFLIPQLREGPILDFELVPTIEAEYLSVKTTLEYTLENMFLLIDKVKVEAAKAKRDRVLIDCRDFTGHMSEAERFLGGKHIAETYGSRLKVALLMPGEQITKLGEMTAVNRGAKFLVTNDEKEAIAFLLS